MPGLYTTKELEVVEPPTDGKEGVGIFRFTDYYTVFFYGRMPDQIPGKGEALARMAAHNFTMLEAAGVPTHFRRFIAPDKIEFSLVRQPERGATHTASATNRIVPLQVIARNELPQGSSTHRRLAAGTLTPQDLGLDAAPVFGQRLDAPIIEYAAMLESPKRFIHAPAAQKLAGLTDEQFRTIQQTTNTSNEVITRHAAALGVSHCDCNFEYMISSRGRIVVADSPGTPDGSRFLVDGEHCGKQIMRNWYAAHGFEPPVQKWLTDGVPKSEWPVPGPLPAGLVPAMTDLYRSLTEAWTGRRIWNAPDLSTAMQAVQKIT